MTAGSALTTALAGLGAASAGIDLASRNIANANAAGYTRKIQTQTTAVDGAPSLGAVQRVLDLGLQKTFLAAASNVGMLDAQYRYASQITLKFGAPADAASLSSLTSALGDAFQTLATSPETDASYTAVINAANRLADGIKSLYGQAGQVGSNAKSELATTIDQANADLALIDTLNKKISDTGGDVTELEDQRDRAIADLAQKLDITTFVRSDGAVSVYTKNGTMLVDVAASTLSSQQVAGTGPVELVVQLAAGPATSTQVFPRSGAMKGLLDVINNQVPNLQAQLDSFADGLTTTIAATGVAPNGLDLFNDGGSTAYAAAAKAGYGDRIAVNQAIIGQPTLIRDGGTSANVSLSSGDTTYIDAVRDVFRANGIVFTDFNGSGVAATNSLAGAAADIITRQSDKGANLDGLLKTETATQTAIENMMSSASGVNLDTEFSHLLQLQQAYATSARIISVTQNMFNALLVASGGTATG